MTFRNLIYILALALLPFTYLSLQATPPPQTEVDWTEEEIDSVNQVIEWEEIAAMEEQVKKEQELLEMQNKILHEELNARRKQLYLILGGIGLVILLLGVGTFLLVWLIAIKPKRDQQQG